MTYKTAIFGYGVVGQWINRLFTKTIGTIVPLTLTRKSPLIYDPNIVSFNDPSKINAIDFGFICVPTPHQHYAGLDMSIVTDVIKKFCSQVDCFICCSALQPGTTDRLMANYHCNIVVQPEYLGESPNHPLSGTQQPETLLLGGSPDDVKKVIRLYQTIYNAHIRIKTVSALEAEVIKLSENRAAAFKIMQCQELYDACTAAGIDYNTIREAVYGDDPRFTLWWTFVYPDNRGMNSKCLPKDVYGWHKWAKEVGIDPILTDRMLSYNYELAGRDNGRDNERKTL